MKIEEKEKREREKVSIIVFCDQTTEQRSHTNTCVFMKSETNEM